MGCFFLDHSCILTAALPLVRSASPFNETGSCDKQERQIQPIGGQRTAVTHFQSSHLLKKKKSNFFHHTPIQISFGTMNERLFMLS